MLEQVFEVLVVSGPFIIGIMFALLVLSRIDGYVRAWLRIREREAEASDRTSRAIEHDSRYDA